MFSSCRYHGNAVSTIIFLLLAIVSWSRLQLNTCYPLSLIFFFNCLHALNLQCTSEQEKFDI